MKTYTTFRTISRCMRDHGPRELLRAAKAAEEAERLDSVPTFRTMRELEEYDRRQREQRVKAQAGLRRNAQKWQRVRRAWAWIVWRLNTPLEV